MRCKPILCLLLLCTAVYAAPGGAETPTGPSGLPGPFDAVMEKVPSQGTNLGKKVNSPHSDFGPIICPDGVSLYFTSDRPGGMGGQDVWVSRREKGSWTKARNLGPPINTPGDEGADSFSISEDALYFTACDRDGGLGGCDIYVSYRLGEKWSNPENLGPPINTEHNDSNASISSDGDFIIFTSDRPGGLGGQDLWIAKRGEKIRKLMPGFETSGRWQEPENLGPNVNTEDWDGVGFIMPDNRTLYFSSRGRGGFGLADIFRSLRLEDGFGEAENMGEIINTPRDDIYFTQPGSGDLAYYSSDRAGGLGMEDIYSIPIPLLIPKRTLVIIRGKIMDEAGSPIMANASAVLPETSEVLARVNSDPETGAYQLIVQEERVTIEVKKPGHKPYRETVQVRQQTTCAMVNRDIKLSKK